MSLQCGTVRRADQLEATVKELDRKLGRLYHDIEGYNADFEALEQIEKYAENFPQVELDELRPLLGLKDVETEKRLPPGKATVEYAVERQHYWTDVRLRARDRLRSGVAERAEARYGLILHEMTQNPADP